MRTILILNPVSGASTMASHQATPEEHQESILSALRAYDIEPEVWYTTSEDPGNGLARRAADEGADIVIAAGGDGTLHAVASGLIETRSTLGIIPMGTMNNIARSLEIPETIEGACEVIGKGETGLIDVGKINDQIFLEVCGIGLEAALFPAAEDIKRVGWLSTVHGVISGFVTLLAFRPTRYRISYDGRRSRELRAIQISVCNTPYYGARLQFAPEAVMNDGFLNVLIYTNFSRLEYLRYAIEISQRKRTMGPKVMRRKIKWMQVRSEQPVETHADGVPLGHTPARISVVPGVLRVRVPEKVALGPGMAMSEMKQTGIDRKARNAQILEEKGPLHVK